MATVETLEGDTFTLGTVHLKIGVSRDEEHVVVTVEHQGPQYDLAPRSHYYLLATVARIRLKESALPESERGWVDVPPGGHEVA
ncbi:hypothetical protein ACN28E_44390 [Archangium lansingense]|uniref:hypothetical protein n=1 Tax=Archangium lansingense TaxID=2995310 RepID=UPI003B793B93